MPTQTQSKQVRFTEDNVMKCQCASCPVQTDSACAMDRVEQMGTGDWMASMSPQDVPKVYCSTGTATCGDLDFSQKCMCPTCDVWAENDLHNYKYCQHGDASKLG